MKTLESEGVPYSWAWWKTLSQAEKQEFPAQLAIAKDLILPLLRKTCVIQ